MHTNAWAALLRHIPLEQHEKLMIVTGSGVEIAIQTILRIDREFLAFKGRLAGSQDQGRLFFLPFVNVDYINLNSILSEETFHAIFDSLEIPDAPGLTAGVMAVEAAPVLEDALPEPEAAPEEEPAPPDGPSSRISQPLKSEVLERFRSRTMAPGSLPRFGE